MKLNINLAKKSIKTNGGLTHAKVDIIPENVKKNTKQNCFVFLVDKSGSMNMPVSNQRGIESISKMDYAKNAIIKFVNELGPNDMIGVISFNNFAKIEQELVEVTKNNLASIILNIKNTNATGGTNMEDGLNLSLNMIKNMDKTNYSTKVILFSDGDANIGIESPKGLGKIASLMFENNIVVTTVGIGLGYDSEVMGAIATNGNGGMYHLENFDNFDTILNEEFEATSNIVATNMKISISEFGLIQVCENLNKYNQKEVDGVIEINIGNILKDKNVALEFKNDFETTDKNIKIELSYIDIEGQKQNIIEYISLKVSEIEDSEENEMVVAYIKDILNADVLTQASGMYDTGNLEGTMDTMQSYKKSLSSLQSTYKSSDFNAQMIECEVLANEFKDNKISRSANKALYASSIKSRRK